MEIFLKQFGKLVSCRRPKTDECGICSGGSTWAKLKSVKDFQERDILNSFLSSGRVNDSGDLIFYYFSVSGFSMFEWIEIDFFLSLAFR